MPLSFSTVIMTFCAVGTLARKFACSAGYDGAGAMSASLRNLEIFVLGAPRDVPACDPRRRHDQGRQRADAGRAWAAPVPAPVKVLPAACARPYDAPGTPSGRVGI